MNGHNITGNQNKPTTAQNWRCPLAGHKNLNRPWSKTFLPQNFIEETSRCDFLQESIPKKLDLVFGSFRLFDLKEVSYRLSVELVDVSSRREPVASLFPADFNSIRFSIDCIISRLSGGSAQSVASLIDLTGRVVF